MGVLGFPFSVVSMVVIIHVSSTHSENTMQNEVRYLTLDILNRVPNHEVQRPEYQKLMECMMDIVVHDNEENAVAAMKKVMELHKAFKGPELERHVQPFLEFVRSMYNDFQNIINFHFPDTPMTEPKKELMMSRYPSTTPYSLCFLSLPEHF